MTKLPFICICLLLVSCAAPSRIQYDISKDGALKKYKCLKTKYDSLLIQNISYCFGPIYREPKRKWSLGYYGKKSVKYYLEEKKRFDNKTKPKCSIFTDPASQHYTDIVILPKGTNIFVEQLWTIGPGLKTSVPSIGFIGKIKIGNSEYRFDFGESQLLNYFTDGHNTYNNYEKERYYQYGPNRDRTLKRLNLVSSRKVTVNEYLDELYDPCD